MSADHTPAELDAAGVQDALVRAIRDFAALCEDQPGLPPFREEHDVTQTEAALTASKLLHCAQIEFFELAMFDSLHTMRTAGEH